MIDEVSGIGVKVGKLGVMVGGMGVALGLGRAVGRAVALGLGLGVSVGLGVTLGLDVALGLGETVDRGTVGLGVAACKVAQAASIAAKKATIRTRINQLPWVLFVQRSHNVRLHYTMPSPCQVWVSLYPACEQADFVRVARPTAIVQILSFAARTVILQR